MSGLRFMTTAMQKITRIGVDPFARAVNAWQNQGEQSLLKVGAGVAGLTRTPKVGKMMA